MGCSSSSIINFKELYNVNLDKKTTECILNNRDLKDDGLRDLCKFELPFLEILYLNNNGITTINYFKDFKAPCLIKLDLSNNEIENIDILGSVNLPLEHLDLSFNKISNIDIFQNENTLPKLKACFLHNNNLNYNDEKIKNIISELNERMARNIANMTSSSSLNECEQKIDLNRLKTRNDKYLNYLQSA